MKYQGGTFIWVLSKNIYEGSNCKFQENCLGMMG